MNTIILNGYVLDSYISAVIDFGSDPFITINPYNTNREIELPMDYVDNGFLTLNVSTKATGYVTIDKTEGYLYVASRFNGVPHEMKIPLECVVVVASRCGTIKLQTPPELITIGPNSTFSPPPEKSPDAPPKQKNTLSVASYNNDVERTSPTASLTIVD